MKIFKRTVNGKEQENYSVRFEHRGKAFLKSLGTNVKAEAERRAKDYFKVVTALEWQELRGALVESVAGRSETATVGLVLSRYVERATDVAQRGKNADALRRVLRAVFPSRDVDGMRTSELTKDVVRRFEAAMLERVGQEYRRYEASAPRVMTDYSVRTTIQTTLRCARSVFGAARMRYYEDLKLGDVSGFLSEPTQAPKRRKPQAPDMAALARMLAAVPELREKSPAAYCAFLMMSELGLRPCEVMKAREWWVRPHEDYFVMDVVSRPDEGFDPKGSEGKVPVGPKVWAELQKYAAMRTDGYLLPGRTPTDRREALERELSPWVGQFLRGPVLTTTYELRRWAGSKILDRHNGAITAARDFLRHADMKTTLDWYAYRINDVKPLDMDWMG